MYYKKALDSNVSIYAPAFSIREAAVSIESLQE